MSETTVIPSQTAAMTNTVDARPYESVVLKCAGLGAAETIAINVITGAAFESVYASDVAGASSTLLTFTGSGGTPANVKQVELVGDYYQVVKGITAGAVTVTAVPGRSKTG